MWRLLFFVAMPLWGEDVFVEEGDVGYLEQRLDDGGVLRDLSLRWRVRGAEKSWERLQVYQRVEWKPRDGQAFFGLVERDPGEREWRDFSAFYYRVAGKMGEVVIGDLRPGFGAGVVFGRGRRSSVNARVPTADSVRLEYRSSGENAAVRGVVWRYGKGRWEGVLLGGRARRDGRLDDAGRGRSLPEGGDHVTATEVAGKDVLALDGLAGRVRWRGARWQWGITALGLDFSRELDLRRKGRTPWGFVGGQQQMGAVDVRGDWGRVWVAAEAARGAGEWWVLYGCESAGRKRDCSGAITRRASTVFWVRRRGHRGCRMSWAGVWISGAGAGGCTRRSIAGRSGRISCRWRRPMRRGAVSGGDGWARWIGGGSGRADCGRGGAMVSCSASGVSGGGWTRIALAGVAH